MLCPPLLYLPFSLAPPPPPPPVFSSTAWRCVRSPIYIEYVHKCHVLVAAPCLRDIDRCLGPARLDTRSYAAFLVARRILCCVCVRLRPVRHARAHTYPAESWRNRGCVRARARVVEASLLPVFTRTEKGRFLFSLFLSFFLFFI